MRTANEKRYLESRNSFQINSGCEKRHNSINITKVVTINLILSLFNPLRRETIQAIVVDILRVTVVFIINLVTATGSLNCLLAQSAARIIRALLVMVTVLFALSVVLLVTGQIAILLLLLETLRILQAMFHALGCGYAPTSSGNNGNCGCGGNGNATVVMATIEVILVKLSVLLILDVLRVFPLLLL